MEHSWKRVPAGYGLIEVAYKKDSTSFDAMLEALKQLDQVNERYSGLKKGKKKKLRKEGISERYAGNLKKQLQEQALELLARNPDLLKYHQYRLVAGRSVGALSSKDNDVLNASVGEAKESARDYATLALLFQEYSQYISKNDMEQSRSLESRLFQAFLDERGIAQLDEFAATFPRHWASLDCWINELAEAGRRNDPVAYLEFLDDFPHSLLDDTALWDGLMPMMEKSGKDALSERQQSRLEEYLTLDRLFRQAYSGNGLPSEFLAEAMASIRQMAPRHLAWRLLRITLQDYLEQRRYEEARTLVNGCRDRFPDVRPAGCPTNWRFYSEKNDWFAIVLELLDQPTEGIPDFALDQLNTYGSEFSPVLSADGKTLYFTGKNRRDNIAGEDIFISHRIGRRWTSPELVTELSGPGDEAPLSLTTDGNQMLLFRDGQLYISQLTPDGWGSPEDIPEINNSFPWIGKTVLSSDGGALIIAASEEAHAVFSHSNIDLFVSLKGPDGRWGSPFKLDTVINTYWQERAPFLHADGETLYFSSNGHPGMGEMDVFVTRRLDNSWMRWSTPENLGKEVNTLYDDWGFSFLVSADGRESIYSRSQQRGYGGSDLYASGVPDLARPRPLVTLEGRVEGVRPEALKNGMLIVDVEGVRQLVKVRPDGTYTATVRPEKEVTISYNQRGIISEMPQFKTMTEDSLGVMEVSPIVARSIREMVSEDGALLLRTVQFDYDEHRVKEQSFAELTRLSKIARAEKVKLCIVGHTDDMGSDDYNRKLSLRRALAVRAFLVEQGLSESMIRVEGRGEEDQLCMEDTEECRRQNRRVEVKFEKSD